MKTDSVISLKNVSFSYGSQLVVDNVTFDIKKGDFVGIVGYNGSGKSTLIKLILGLLPRSKGKTILFNKSLESFNEFSRVGYVPQNISITNSQFPATVFEVISLGLIAKNGFNRRISPDDTERINKKLSQFKLIGLQNKRIGELSGGQLQRVFLARALLLDPELLILDEPASALDAQTREEFFSYLRKINSEKNATILFISHDMSHIADRANKLMIIERELIFFGTFRQFCSSKEMTKIFGKESQHSICHQHIQHA